MKRLLIAGLVTVGLVFSAPARAVPVAVDDVYSTPMNVPLPIDILANDVFDPLFDPVMLVSVFQFPLHGSLSGDPLLGTQVYSPIADFFGDDLFLYQIGGAFLSGPIAVVTIHVTGGSEVPLPGALPLFASGIGVLGFLNWRSRKRRYVARTRCGHKSSAAETDRSFELSGYTFGGTS